MRARGGNREGGDDAGAGAVARDRGVAEGAPAADASRGAAPGAGAPGGAAGGEFREGRAGTDWDEWGIDWLAFQAARNTREHVIQAGKALDLWRRFLEQRGVMHLRDVTARDVAAFPAWRIELRRSGKRVGAATVNRCIAHFKALFTWLEETEQFTANPTKKLKLLKEYKGEEPIRIIEPERFEAIVAQLEKTDFTHWANACMALLGTGMRWGSLVRLRPEHLDETRKMVRLSKPKGKVAVDLQITSERVWSALVWCAKDGKFNPDVGSFNKAIRVAAEGAGVPKFTAHMLRHTFAVRALDAGANIRDVMRWMGHAQLSTTERYQRHAKPKPPPEML